MTFGTPCLSVVVHRSYPLSHGRYSVMDMTDIVAMTSCVAMTVNPDVRSNNFCALRRVRWAASSALWNGAAGNAGAASAARVARDTLLAGWTDGGGAGA